MGTVRKRPVEVEADDMGRMRILSGVEAGARIVAAGAGRLADGQDVRIYTGLTE